MTGLMKAADSAGQATVRHFRACPDDATGLSSQPEPARPDPARIEEREAQLRHHITRLEKEVEDLQEQIEDASVRAEMREQESYDQGCAAGKSEERAKDGDRIVVLTSGIAAAQAAFLQREADVEVLALAAAQTAIGKILAPPEKYAGMIGDAVAAQIQRLRGELGTAIQVSSEDFPNEDALQDLAARFPRMNITAAPGLAAGECVMDLKIGHLDIGIPGQWSNVQRLFAELADEAGIEP